MDYGWQVMSLERNESRLGAAMIMEGSWFHAIIVRGRPNLVEYQQDTISVSELYILKCTNCFLSFYIARCQYGAFELRPSNHSADKWRGRGMRILYIFACRADAEIVNECWHNWPTNLHEVVSIGKVEEVMCLLYPVSFQVRCRHPITLIRYADKRIVDIMTVYIESNNMHLELIRNSKQCWLYSRLLLRTYGFNPISPIDWASTHSPAMLACSLDGSRCSCHAYQNVSNTTQFNRCHFWTVIGDSNYLLFAPFLTGQVDSRPWVNARLVWKIGQPWLRWTTVLCLLIQYWYARF